MANQGYDEDIEYISKMNLRITEAFRSIRAALLTGLPIRTLQDELVNDLKRCSAHFRESVRDGEYNECIVPASKVEGKALTRAVILRYLVTKDEDVADSFVNELSQSGQIPEAEMRQLRHIRRCYPCCEAIADGIVSLSLDKAKQFVSENREYFNAHSDARLSLLILEFLKARRDNGIFACIDFLRKEIFSYLKEPRHRETIREALLFVIPGIEDGKLREICEETAMQYRIHFSLVNQYPVQSFLEILFENGSASSDVLVKASHAFKNVDVSKMIDSEMIVSLPRIGMAPFHSLFVCPVLKCVCDNDNLPVLLECGHVISQNAVAQISKSGTTRLFKCPYCPAECGFDNSRVLFLRC